MTITFGRWRLTALDERNWELWERCETRPTHLHPDAVPRLRWKRRKEYFQELGHALRRVMEYEARRDGAEVDLPGAIERYEEIAAALSDVEVA